MTAQTGTGRPTAEKTGEPAEPGRATARHPSRDATKAANSPAAAGDRTGTKRQAGAAEKQDEAENTRTAHTSRPQRRATTGAERRTAGTETKPERAMTHPQNREPKPPRQPRRDTPKERKTGKKRENAFRTDRGEHGCKGRRAVLRRWGAGGPATERSAAGCSGP